ncbi:MAG: 3D domain-containing protein [Puniceicoccales bacterium]|jgi:3D (Asp-Asp-Asp) domain-containing protein|nr:3D domain-containing protein [Puniceicoccales bacterium]
MKARTRRRLRWGALFCALPVLAFAAGRLAPRDDERARTLLVTAYCNCEKCCEWTRDADGEPVFASGPLKGKRKVVGKTASGLMTRPGTAASAVLPFGTLLVVEGAGVFQVEDRGRLRSDQIDLWFPTHAEALRWGRQRRKVIIVTGNGTAAGGSTGTAAGTAGDDTTGGTGTGATAAGSATLGVFAR